MAGYSIEYIVTGPNSELPGNGFTNNATTLKPAINHGVELSGSMLAADFLAAMR